MTVLVADVLARMRTIIAVEHPDWIEVPRDYLPVRSNCLTIQNGANAQDCVDLTAWIVLDGVTVHVGGLVVCDFEVELLARRAVDAVAATFARWEAERVECARRRRERDAEQARRRDLATAHPLTFALTDDEAAWWDQDGRLSIRADLAPVVLAAIEAHLRAKAGES